jgi:amino acid adenylation domain-containing protein
MTAERVLGRLVEAAAMRHADGVAVRLGEVSLYYGALVRRVNGLARVLVSTGLQRGDRVAVWLGRTFDVPVSFHGTFVAGGALVPIDPKSPIDQAAEIIRSTGATHLVTEPSRTEAVLEVLAQCPDLRHIVGITDSSGPATCTPWSSVLQEEGDQPPGIEVTERDPAYILHTSGSTGRPKLILHTHSSAISFVEWAAAEYALTSDDRLTNHSSHHTCFATFDFYAAARAAATTVLLTPSALMMPATLSSLLEREGVTVWYSVPAALVQLSLRGDLENRDLRSLRWVLFAGETFPGRHLRRLREQLPGARFSHVYGSTEVNVCTFYHLPEGDLAPGPLPIGRSCSTSSALVADASMQPVAQGEAGDLFVRGSTVMSGYWNDDERNREVLVQRPGEEGVYFRTGDRARLLADGNLAFVARADRQVKIRGHRVELDEVEGALVSLPAVEEAAAYTVPDAEGSSALHAAVVVGGNGSTDGRALTGELKTILPPHAIPSLISVVESMPRTPTGKVDVRALAAQESERVGQG